jgi:hypothetical protein
MSPSMRLKIGSRLVALAYAVSLVMWAIHTVMVATGDQSGSRHGLPTSIMVLVISAAGIAIALGPLARRRAWAFWLALAPWVLLGGAKIATDPACTTHFFAVHGCHTVAGTLLLAVIGFVIAAKPVFAEDHSAG